MATVRRRPHLEQLFHCCEFCGSRPIVEELEDGDNLRYRVRCPMDKDGPVDTARSLPTLILLWASSQVLVRKWLDKDLLI